ncbi:phosphotransferase [Streptomyces sp. NPDC056773]|uniref:phosphotransferase n=1 Tax=unclassified Streptomyces TaxID=2593676 RepID=UPI00369CA65C
MSGEQRHRVPVDVHLILRRDTAAGPEVLLSRRAGEVYAAGMWHLVSGHIDGPHEDMLTALIRESHEEAGITIAAADVRHALTVHHRGPGGRARIGVFFEVSRWEGTPSVREPAVCDAMDWFPLHALPEPLVAYCRAGLDTYLAGESAAVHFQEPGDPIEYAPSLDRRRPLASAFGPKGPAGAGGPGGKVREFTERAVGRIRTGTDTSWPRDTSRVWRADGTTGGVWYVKTHQNDRFHRRETRALRNWVPGLGATAPRLVAADPVLRTVVVTAVPGRSLHGAVHPVEEERLIFRRIGELAARIHAATTHTTTHTTAPAGPTAAAGRALGKLGRHLDTARPFLAPGDEEFITAVAARAAALPVLPVVATHGDLQLRNLLWEPGRQALHVIDFERSEDGPAVRDFVRLADAWYGRPDLFAALISGYGRTLTTAEEQHMELLSVLDAVSAIAYAARHDDPEPAERGHRTLRRLQSTRSLH